MKHLILASFLISSYAWALVTTSPPIAERTLKKLEIHGDIREDYYFWLKQRENKKVLDYLHAENKYTESVMQPHQKSVDKFFNEFVNRIKLDDISAPYKSNGYEYYHKTSKQNNYPTHYRRNLQTKKEELLLDINAAAKNHKFTRVVGITVSPNNKVLAYAHDTQGRNFYTIYFKDLETQKMLPQQIENVSNNLAWSADNNTLFYSKQDPQTLRSHQIYRYDMQSKKSSLVYEEKDTTMEVIVYGTHQNRLIFISSWGSQTSEVRYIDANLPSQEPKLFQAKIPDVEYEVIDGGDVFFILTNKDAKNFKVMTTPLNNTNSSSWQDFVPYDHKKFIRNLHVSANHIVVGERIAGLDQIRIIDRKNKNEQYIKFTDQAYLAGFSMNEEYHTNKFNYTYQSMTTPSSVIEYDLNTGKQVIIKEQEILGGFDKNNYVSERVFATAKDGSKIPLSIVYKKGLKKDGNNPGLIYGYGSYGASMSPYFSNVNISLLDRGFVYTIAHIRGGSDMGREWYDNGKMFNKINTFTDFIEASEYLIAQKYVSKNKLFAKGESAGGLLMGAITNMRPDLYLGIHAGVPFVDVVTTMLDDSIPLTTGEYKEWGNPNNKESYMYMKSYSPYDQVKAQKYPNLLVTTGLHDSQVQYWEPAKWVAKLRYLKKDNNLILLKTDMTSGHGGASGRYDAWKEIAYTFAFFEMLLK